jgi:hypothetical protein
MPKREGKINLIQFIFLGYAFYFEPNPLQVLGNIFYRK